jgi:hypothetical protein
VGKLVAKVKDPSFSGSVHFPDLLSGVFTFSKKKHLSDVPKMSVGKCMMDL